MDPLDPLERHRGSDRPDPPRGDRLVPFEPRCGRPARTRTRGQDQRRDADAFEQPERVLFPQCAEDLEVVRPRQTWPDPPLRIHADERQEDLVELGCDGDRAPRLRWTRRRNLSTVIPPNSGGASIRFAVAQSNRSRIVTKPPSSNTVPPTERDRRTASSSATFAPHECPTTIGRCRRVERITAAASSVVSVEAVAGGRLGGPAVSPLVVGDRVEPEPDEPRRDEVPDVRGRREPVDQAGRRPRRPATRGRGGGRRRSRRSSRGPRAPGEPTVA